MFEKFTKNFAKDLIKLSLLPRRVKQLLLLLLDFIALSFSLWLAFALRLGEFFPAYEIQRDIWLFILVPVVTIPIFIIRGLYQTVLQFMGSRVIWVIVTSITFATLAIGFGMMMVREVTFPRSIFFMYWYIAIMATLATRYLPYLLIYSYTKKIRSLKSVAIYGCGQAGTTLAENINSGSSYNLVAIIDDDKTKVGTVLRSVKVYSPEDIDVLIKKKQLQLILLAMPSIGKARRFQILRNLAKYPVEVMELPSVENIIDGKVTVDDIRRVHVADILGREPVKPDTRLLKSSIAGKNVLITGAGGSIGSELTRQVIDLNPRKVILFERCEYNLYTIHQEVKSRAEHVEVVPILGTITHENQLDDVFKSHQVQTVYHAAAYKHVPMVEANPIAGIWNNIIGTFRAASSASANGVELFVLISTDKAVRPTSIMGATKRFAELILQGINSNGGKTCFTMVRFGNVLDSAGSVVPLFRKQIRNGGPVTITDKDMTRYFMTIPEAVQLVIQAGSMAKGGEVFVLDMGDPVNIYDLARSMIYLSDLTPIDEKNPGGDIAIKTIGLRPGEKLYEELLIGDEDQTTEHPRIRKANEKKHDWKTIQTAISEFTEICKKQDTDAARTLIGKYIEEYKP